MGRKDRCLLRIHDLPGNHPLLLRRPAPGRGRGGQPLRLQPDGGQSSEQANGQRRRPRQVHDGDGRLRGLPVPAPRGGRDGPLHPVPEALDVPPAGRQRHPAAAVPEAPPPVVPDTIRFGGILGPVRCRGWRVPEGPLLRALQVALQEGVHLHPGALRRAVRTMMLLVGSAKTNNE